MLVEGAPAKLADAPLTAAGLVKLPRWRKVEPLVKSYLGNTLHLLGGRGMGREEEQAGSEGSTLPYAPASCAAAPPASACTGGRRGPDPTPFRLQSNPCRRLHLSGAVRSRRQPRATSEGLYLAAPPAHAAVAVALSCGPVQTHLLTSLLPSYHPFPTPPILHTPVCPPCTALTSAAQALTPAAAPRPLFPAPTPCPPPGALTDGAMLTFILRRLRASVVLLAPFDKLQRRLLKAALGLFGSADNTARVQAILLVRQLALDLPQPTRDNCLKVGGLGGWVGCGAGGCGVSAGRCAMPRTIPMLPAARPLSPLPPTPHRACTAPSLPTPSL